MSAEEWCGGQSIALTQALASQLEGPLRSLTRSSKLTFHEMLMIRCDEPVVLDVVLLLNFLTDLYITIYPAASNKLSHHLFGTHCAVALNINRKRCICGAHIFDKQDFMGSEGFSLDQPSI